MRNDKRFEAPWWLRNRHVQSCIGVLLRSHAELKVEWQQFELSDGDFVDVAWMSAAALPAGVVQQIRAQACDADSAPQTTSQVIERLSVQEDEQDAKSLVPIVLLVTGFEGGFNAHYVQLMAKNALAAGWHVAVIHYRGCGGRINRLARTYHVGDYTDCHEFIKWLQQACPQAPLYAVGFSMGANVWVKYLRHYPDSPLRAVGLVSSIFDVKAAVAYCSKLYQARFVRTMLQKLSHKLAVGQDLPITAKQLKQLRTMRDIDRAVTAPLFAYACENAYYDYASIADDLPHISAPMLLLHAKDDPFVPLHTVPSTDELHSQSQLILSSQGGHLGFISGPVPWQLDFWGGECLMRFFKEYQD